jgi:hypothetical protein
VAMGTSWNGDPQGFTTIGMKGCKESRGWEFTGLKCKVKIDHCPDNGSDTENQSCLNDMPCSPDNDGSSWGNLVKKFGCLTNSCG